MKRFSVLLLLLLLLLSSCTAPTGQGEATSGENVTTAEVTTAEIMSEEVSDSITESEPIENIHPTLKPTNFSKEDIQIGMSFSEVIEPFGEESFLFYGKANYIYYNNYIFLLDKDGNSLVIRFDAVSFDVAEVRVYPPRTAMGADADFEAIELGMSVFEVVERVGLPIGSSGNGFVIIVFQSAEGTRYRLDWEDGIINYIISNKEM